MGEQVAARSKKKKKEEPLSFHHIDTDGRREEAR